MSGDIQTRQRRKEKRKQKRDEPTIGVDTSNFAEAEKKHVQMHVSEEDHHDVGWCAKIVFFILMAILTGLVVLIFLENRGGSDLDTPLSESRFSEYLKGWVDETREDDHMEEHFMNQHDEHDAEGFVNDVVLEEEKDGSNHEDELNAEANMFESDIESPEEHDAISSGSPDFPDSPLSPEDSLPFDEDSAPLEEEEDENETEMEEFAGLNDDGEDLLLQKLSEQTKQELVEEEEEEEYLKDNEDESQIAEDPETQEIEEANRDEDNH